MVINPKKSRRRSFRLQDYDYGQPGFYYITICTEDRKAMLGNVVNGEMCLNHAGSDQFANKGFGLRYFLFE
jgi:putative transposase